MIKSSLRPRVGDMRPSQLMFTYGVGAIVDLPKISVIVAGLEDWPHDPAYVQPIIEERLLTAVRYKLPTVGKLLAAPVNDSGPQVDPLSPQIGVPVATFPRWMVCPLCRLLAPLSSGLFKLKENRFQPDRTAYEHGSCSKGHSPDVIPARFLVACEAGHLDDFPWVEFAHQGSPCTAPSLRLIEFGPSGEARDLEVRCETCKAQRRLSEAFGQENLQKLPVCRGRRPHLRDFDPAGCKLKGRPLILGASNTWFPVTLSTVAIPVEGGKLAQLVDQHWGTLQEATSPTVLKAFRAIGQLGGDLGAYSDEKLWAAIENRRQGPTEPKNMPDLKSPEWDVFTHFDPDRNNDDFQLRPVDPPGRFQGLIQQVVLVERLREVSAMIGFTRLDSPGELSEPEGGPVNPAPLSRQKPTWVPASEVRGEGIFIQFNEERLTAWLAQEAITERGGTFFEAHQNWRKMRHMEPDGGFPGMRYVLLHTFSHALMRQFALECGYAAASIRERLYARPPEVPGGPMAGLLIYTSAPDSEGTLGGLVGLGEPAVLERHFLQALEAARLCASDPLCAERLPSQTGQTLHAAACHACLFSSETSCECGNRYLDRSVLTTTVERSDLAFFDGQA